MKTRDFPSRSLLAQSKRIFWKGKDTKPEILVRKLNFTNAPKTLVLFAMMFFTLIACKKEEEEETGDVVVWTFVKGFDGVKSDDIVIGIFDMVLIEQSSSYMRGRDALFTERFTHISGDRYEAHFPELLPGNYFASPINPAISSSFRQSFQVRRGTEIEVELK